ncbi:glycoside hydrolase family 3 C-terminal domain-containing protein [Aurantivibrio infirmus]
MGSLMKKFLIVVCAVFIFQSCSSKLDNQHSSKNSDLNIDERADDIVSQLSLQEKLAVIDSSAVPRLNIPDPGSSESIHQVVSRGGPGIGEAIPTTSFAQVVGMGMTWNPNLIKRAGGVAGYEGRYITQNEKYKRNTLMLWGPTADLARDPRWGRNDESFGEDAFLTGTMSVAYIKGIQGDDPNYWQGGTLLKHFVANSNETNRSSSSSNFDERLMYEYYAAPFRMGFLEGGAKSYMTAYNAWNSVPMLVHPMLTEVVAEKWGANWIVSSDAGAQRHAVSGHKYLDNELDVYAAAVKAGVNQYLDFSSDNATDMIELALKENKITEDDLNKVVANKLKPTLKLGMLDDPEDVPYSVIGTDGEAEPWLSEKHQAVAREVARESVVLLKNNNDLLPIDKNNTKSIAVIGDRADEVLFDFYSGVTPYAVSVLQGITDRAGADIEINYARDNSDDAALDAAKKSDYAVVVVGNDPMCGATNPPFAAFNPDGSTKPCLVAGDGREGRDRESIDLPTEELIKQVYAANPNTIVVLVSSFPYAINWSEENIPAILTISHAAQEQGNGLADVLFGDYNPAGRLVQTWPKSLDQLPPLMDYDLRNGRTYMYMKEQPLYPFGYGLSYTSFDYSNLKVSNSEIDKTDSINVSVEIKNSGDRGGDEVVQLYIQHVDSKVSRPIKELKAFQRVNIKAGESKVVQLSLAASSLAWWNEEKQEFEVESGKINLLVGPSSSDIKLESTVQIQ